MPIVFYKLTATGAFRVGRCFIKSLVCFPEIVSVDTAATSFFNQIRSMPMDVVKHLELGEELGLGTTDLNKLNIKRIRL